MDNNTNTKKSRSPLTDLLPIIIGEVAVAILVCLGFYLADLIGLDDSLKLLKFDSSVVFGAILGVAVILINHAVLILSVDREIKKFIANRPKGELSDEEADLYTKKHSMAVQKTMTVSFMARSASIFVALIVAFLLLDIFNPLAATIPMFAFRFLIPFVDKALKKHEKAPDPAKFIKYDDENNEEKEEE